MHFALLCQHASCLLVQVVEGEICMGWMQSMLKEHALSNVVPKTLKSAMIIHDTDLIVLRHPQTFVLIKASRH